MTSTTTPPAVQTSHRPPWRLGLTLLHLAVLGTLGWAVIGLFIAAIGAGIGLLFALGVGLLVLLGVLYELFGLAWFEIERVASLCAVPVPTLTSRHAPPNRLFDYLKSFVFTLS